MCIFEVCYLDVNGIDYIVDVYVLLNGFEVGVG